MTGRHRETQMKRKANGNPFLPLSRTLMGAHWWFLALMCFIPLGCGLTPLGLRKPETETYPSWLSIFSSHLCQLLTGTHPRFCRSSRQASNDEHTGMQSHVRKSSNLKDLQGHQIPTPATLPSGDPASPKHCHILRQPIPYLDSSVF